jgi:hypothetical protein
MSAMPFDLTSDEKIIRWRIDADDCRLKAKSARTDQERNACLGIAESYESLIRSEEQLIAQRNRGILHYLSNRGLPQPKSQDTAEATSARKILFWRARAAEIRLEAAKMAEPRSRQNYLDVAANYETLASAEERSLKNS